MNDNYRKMITQDYLEWFLKLVSYAREEMSSRTVLEWATELGIPPYFPSPHAEAEEPDQEVLIHFIIKQHHRFHMDYSQMKNDHRIEDEDWSDGYVIADDILAQSGLNLSKGRCSKELRDHVACIHTGKVSSRKSQQMPAKGYNTTRPGNKSWYS